MSESLLESMIWRLGTRVSLSDADRAAVRALPHVQRSYNASAYVVREGEPSRAYCNFIQEGFAFRQKLTAAGTRQIVSLHLRGDFIDLQQLFLNTADHNVQALTNLKVVGIEREALQALTLEHPSVGRGLWIDALIDSSIYQEWVMNVGRRDARARIAHVLCELALRMKAAGSASTDGFQLPLTQEQLADVVGLTTVHVSRTLKSLERDGIVHRAKRYITFKDWDAVASVGGFNPLYLHLDQASSQHA